MAGLSPKLPLARDEQDGYALNRTYYDLVRQNLKHLILCNPGERVMDPLFGVGIKRFLFEQNVSSTWTNISAKIHEQVNKYLPFIRIIDISFVGPEEQDSLFNESNFLPITVKYTIIPLGTDDVLDLVVS